MQLCVMYSSTTACSYWRQFHRFSTKFYSHFVHTQLHIQFILDAYISVIKQHQSKYLSQISCDISSQLDNLLHFPVVVRKSIFLENLFFQTLIIYWSYYLLELLPMSIYKNNSIYQLKLTHRLESVSKNDNNILYTVSRRRQHSQSQTSCKTH